MKTYQETLDFLFSQLPMYQKVGKSAFKKDLTNTRALLEALGNPEQTFKSIHIAGTNGKGSSAAMLNAILIEAGYHTGCYTSPHLKSFTERITLNGQPIHEEEVIAFTELIQPQIKTIQPSFFEITVAMAFWYFSKQEVDIAIIETGLGGRLDSTNVITPEVALITKIGMDHMDMLGNTLAAIAGEKAGIIKPNVPTVLGSDQPEIIHVFEEKARSLDSELIVSRDRYRWESKEGPIGKQTIDLQVGETLMYESLEVNSAADYVLDNLPGVLEVLEKLRPKYAEINEQAIRQGLAKFQLKGRMQLLSRNPLVVADVSHNEQGLKALFHQVRQWPVDKLRIVLGLVREKDLSTVLTILPKDAIYYFTQSQVPRALPLSALKIAAMDVGMHGAAFANVNIAMAEAKTQAGENDCILICGSTFVVAEINDL
ncbi:MAG: folylpolyglutamate synthase/dihydrofolate synthase family protein [Cytophagales bacterium]|nr:folylpolyglutamate synthase/dihydrofolate synthase family protein [Cytophagales bacterium]